MTAPTPDRPDLSAFAAAVRFRDRATAAATAYHERVGLPGSMHYARATFDAIAQMIREDERERLAAAGRLLAEPEEIRTEWAVYWHGEDGGIRYDERQFSSREEAERRGPQMAGIHGITRWSLHYCTVSTWNDSTLVGPWLPVPTTEGPTDA